MGREYEDDENLEEFGEDEDEVEDPSPLKDIEEAVAVQKIAAGHYDPFESGQGHSGRIHGNIEPYEKLARQNGTTAAQALKDYMEIERRVRDDPKSGIQYIQERLGLVAPSPQTALENEIEEFSRTHKHFDEVRLDMSRLVNEGKAADLATAYRLACRNNQKVRVAQLAERVNRRH